MSFMERIQRRKQALAGAKDWLLRQAGQDEQFYDRRLYAVREFRYRKPSGTETVELRLYKLVEGVAVDYLPDGRIERREGVVALRDFPTDPDHPDYYDPYEKARE